MQIAHAAARAQGVSLVRLLRIVEPLPRCASNECAALPIADFASLDINRFVQLAHFTHRIQEIEHSGYYAIAVRHPSWNIVASCHFSPFAPIAQRKRLILEVKESFISSDEGVSKLCAYTLNPFCRKYRKECRSGSSSTLALETSASRQKRRIWMQRDDAIWQSNCMILQRTMVACGAPMPCRV